jgi:RNA polymerase sigma-70 factor (ECF subfamily)
MDEHLNLPNGHGAQSGVPDDADQLFARYARRLTRLAAGQLSPALAGRLDAEDVIQSVFRTFFRRSDRGEFTIDSSGQLWQLLVKITLMKARAKGRYHTASKRAATAEARGDANDWLPAALDHEPGPEDVVALVDQIEVLLHGLPPFYRQLLELRLSGHPVAEVAEQLNLSRQTIYRALKVLQNRLENSSNGPE